MNSIQSSPDIFCLQTVSLVRLTKKGPWPSSTQHVEGANKMRMLSTSFFWGAARIFRHGAEIAFQSSRNRRLARGLESSGRDETIRVGKGAGLGCSSALWRFCLLRRRVQFLPLSFFSEANVSSFSKDRSHTACIQENTFSPRIAALTAYRQSVAPRRIWELFCLQFLGSAWLSG